MLFVVWQSVSQSVSQRTPSMAMACACGACVYVFYANVGKETKRLCCKEIIKKMISGSFLFFFSWLAVLHVQQLCNVVLIGRYDVSDAYYPLIR